MCVIVAGPVLSRDAPPRNRQRLFCKSILFLERIWPRNKFIHEPFDVLFHRVVRFTFEWDVLLELVRRRELLKNTRPNKWRAIDSLLRRLRHLTGRRP